jgi:hypothetical protein
MNEESMKAAIELHRPVLYDRWGNVTSDPQSVSAKFGQRCAECRESVPAEGCRTWKAANA